MEKCELSFSHKLDTRLRHHINSILGFREVVVHGKYLGLPTVFDKSKKISFTNLCDRVWRKVQGWKEKMIFRAGKEVLIKSVLQAIPSYTMSCFKLLIGVCKDLSNMIRRFWWGILKDRKGICWKAWGFLCRLKDVGGLGFRDFEAFNQAM